MKPVLSISNLNVALPAGGDRQRAVTNVNLIVNPGEVVCLVGESGSGKSVIAHTIMGLSPDELPVLSGEILLEGENLLKASQSRLRELRCVRMSMVFQEPMTALNPVMRCGAQLDEVLRMHTDWAPEKRRSRIREIIDEVQLPDPDRVINSFPHQLSGGQRQRIMIAMALIMEPVLLIADEPTTALDVTTQAQILRLIRDLQRKKGTGVLFITHDFGVVADIADRVVVLHLGDLVETQQTLALLNSPKQAYTRMLIDAVPSLKPRQRIPAKTAEAPETVLKVTGLKKEYERRGFFSKTAGLRAVDGVDLQIGRGQTLGIVGESGSGKSTLARCVARLITPSSGSVQLNGSEIATMRAGQLRPLRRRVQMVFQDPYRSLNPRWTVGDSIIEGPLNFGVSKDAAMRRARTLMETVQLDARALDRYPHQFSGGQRQRICIARALAMEPELLIADEAVSALDVSVQAQVLALLDEIRSSMQLAMLFITHDLRVAAQICDHVAVMSRGRVVEYGSAEQVFSAPKHEYTQTLLAAAPGRSFSFGCEPETPLSRPIEVASEAKFQIA
ncbi:ABC transporter ATP-binding protein [Ottowia thiooxydans]|uniref:ABC transporter ATP-binding protein n=1 Tax=Ottowia thiooxydans TaxID=219182 RepID=UPI000401DD1A|nr:ABC transporter ATP-binding protein [Ottowia thiooxydans]